MINAGGYWETDSTAIDAHNRLLSSLQTFTGDVRQELEYGHVAMTSFDRPAGIGFPDGVASTVFTYNAAGVRTRMTRDEDQYGIHMDRYYLGGVYERDVWHGGSGADAERLFLGGSAYDAPMVLVKAASVNGGAWTPFNILRDVQGSITEVTSADGETVVESFRYDPWGLRIMMDGVAAADSIAVDMPDLPDSPGEGDVAVADSTVAVPGWQMAGRSIYVGGHGYTGHEHLPGWGLINMNARLYDPALCRFLSPDPLLQDPSNTQNFNRYTYCLNNPLKYTDESGEVVVEAIIVGAIFAAIIDYGTQVVVNYSDKSMDPKDIWFGNIDFLEVGINGLIGGLTAGFGSASLSAGALKQLIQNNLNSVLTIVGAAISSMLSYTPNNGFEAFEEGFGWELVSNLIASGVSARTGDLIELAFKQKGLKILQPLLNFAVSTAASIGENYIHDVYNSNQSQLYGVYDYNQPPYYYGGSKLPFPK